MDDLTVPQLVAAVDGIDSERREKLRVAAFPVWLEHGKRGFSFNDYLRRLGLAEKPRVKKSRKLARPDLDQLYDRAEQIRVMDLKR